MAEYNMIWAPDNWAPEPNLPVTLFRSWGAIFVIVAKTNDFGRICEKKTLRDLKIFLKENSAY